MRKHTGEKLYKCDECNSSISLKVSLITNMRIRTGSNHFRIIYVTLHLATKVALGNT
jgi:hypothetical protein